MTTQLLTRDQLGLRPPSGDYTRLDAEGITLHHGGPTPWPAGWATVEQFLALCDHRRCPSIWRGWQDYHMTPGALGTVAPAHPIDIAYTSGVCPHGVRLEGRGPMHRSAANGSSEGNRRSYAVVYLGGLRPDGVEDPLTDAAKLAFLDEADRVLKGIRWVHRDWYTTACPGTQLYAWQRANCPAPGALGPPHPPVPVVPPLVTITTVHDLEDDVKVAIHKVPIPDMGSKPDDAYVDLAGQPGLPFVPAGRCLSVRVNGADTTGGGGPGEVRDVEHGLFTRLRFRGFDAHAKPTVIVSALVD